MSDENPIDKLSSKWMRSTKIAIVLSSLTMALFIIALAFYLYGLSSGSYSVILADLLFFTSLMMLGALYNLQRVRIDFCDDVMHIYVNILNKHISETKRRKSNARKS